ncbi:MAG TPA: hypothetical protein VK196_03985 [Magnetospirillum sp.]|nr:hypothetical protein [Magnetospirillum sp.]
MLWGGSTMIIDTEDQTILSQLNPLEKETLRKLADRLAMAAWQRTGYRDVCESAPATSVPGRGRAFALVR